MRRIVDAVNAAGPDLVALCGDYVDPCVPGGGRMPPVVVAHELARLRAPAVAVLGNHDWAHEGHAMADALRTAGLPVLENDAVRVAVRGGEEVWVAGLADERERDPRAGAALAAVPEGEPALVLSHDPDAFPYVPARAALTLAGHLHGGQVDVPGLAARIPSRHGARYKAGHVVEHGRNLFVSRGLGETGRAVRFRSPPEVPLLTLRSGA